MKLLTILVLLLVSKTSSIVPGVSIVQVDVPNSKLLIKNDTPKSISVIDAKSCSDADHCRTVLVKGTFAPNTSSWSDKIDGIENSGEITLIVIVR